ncbi:MAG: hypothetical protein Q9226_000786 [Calogaya cf. arnoldii]
MVDDVLDKKSDGQLGTTFKKTLGTENGTKVLNDLLRNNPQFTEESTRLDVFDAIAEECHRQDIYVHLDNHVSSAGWCCKSNDGNAWFGDKAFDVKKWTRALAYMAAHGKKWKNFKSIGLRNELRASSSPATLPINWDTWQGNMTAGAEAVYEANKDLLIFFSGMGYDSRLKQIFSDSLYRDIDFDTSKFAYKDKIVLEVHDYDFGETDCTNKMKKLTDEAFGALEISKDVKKAFPLVMSEWGFGQSLDQYQQGLPACLRYFLPEMQVGWMTWVLTGSYYIREGEHDYDETWGLLDHEGKNWRCPECINDPRGGLRTMIQATLGERSVATA